MSESETPGTDAPGLTDEDRERLSDLLDRNRGRGMDSGRNLPDPESDLVSSVRVELAAVKHIDGREHVKSTRIGDALGYTAKQVAVAMKVLQSEGTVSRWGGTRNGVTWEIHL